MYIIRSRYGPFALECYPIRDAILSVFSVPRLESAKREHLVKKLFYDQFFTKECAVREHVMQFQVNKFIHYQRLPYF